MSATTVILRVFWSFGVIAFCVAVLTDAEPPLSLALVGLALFFMNFVI